MRVGRAAVARHLHPQLAAVEHRPVHGVHGVFGVALVVEPDEGEAPGLLGVAVPRNVHVADAPVFLAGPFAELPKAQASGSVQHGGRAPKRLTILK